MSTKSRAVAAGWLIGAASTFAILCGAGISDSLTYIFMTLSLVFVLAAAAVALHPDYTDRVKRHPGAFLPLCKEKLKSAGAICLRCTGYYFGFAASVFMMWLVHEYSPLLSALKSVHPVWLLLAAILFVTPTAWHGQRRRRELSDPLPQGSWRILMGFLAGLAFFLSFIACYALFA